MSYRIKSKKLSVLVLILGLIPVSAYPMNWGHIFNRTTAKRAGYTVGALATAAAATGLGWLAYKNPGYAQITAGTAGLLSLGYLYNSRVTNNELHPVIKDAQQITKFLSIKNGSPSTYSYFRRYACAGKPAFDDSHLKENKNAVMRAIQLDNIKGLPAHVVGNFASFKQQTIDDLELELNQLNNLDNELRVALAKCSVLPQVNTSLTELDAYILSLKPNDRQEIAAYKDLTKGEIDQIKAWVKDRTTIPFYKPHSFLRALVLPQESALLQEMWNVYQLIGRVALIKECVTNSERGF